MNRYLVPGNLLIAGEYAVTEPGGTGIALAVSRYVEMTIEPANELAVEGHFGTGSRTVYPLDTASVPAGSEKNLADRVISYLEQTLDLDIAALSGRVRIDSRQFFDIRGRKLGYGSSAAVSIALCAALCSLSGMNRQEADKTVKKVAVEAHRYAQGGRGSGYDVLASLYGGVGVVTGGEVPTYTPITDSWISSVGVLSPGKEVRTTGALLRYEAWKQMHPQEHREFLANSAECVGRIAFARTFEEALPALQDAKEIGANLGRSIGVDADVSAWVEDDERRLWFWKALGAGNELAGCLSASDAFPQGTRIENVDTEGARWQ